MSFSRSLLWFVTGYSTIGMIVYSMRHSKFPIQQRRSWIVVLESIGFLVVTATEIALSAFPSLQNITCFIPRLVTVWFFQVAVQLAVLRVFLLLYWSLITESFRSSFSKEVMGNFFIKKRRLFPISSWVLISICCGTFHFILNSILSVDYYIRFFPFIFQVSHSDPICSEFYNVSRSINLGLLLFTSVFPLLF